MELKKALRISGYPRLALVGAGGKTTALFRLARELEPPVIVTTSTHLSIEQTQLADRHILLSKIEDANLLEDVPLSGVILLSGPIAGPRATGLSEKMLLWLQGYCGYHSLPLLIEADGARQLPLKAPAPHEPPIPVFVDTVVVVAGISAIGKPLTAAWVHRPERFAALSGLTLGEIITPKALARVLRHGDGGSKNIPDKARRVVLLNQVEAPELQAAAEGLASLLLPDFDAVVAAALAPEGGGQLRGGVIAVREPVAGVVLAAGEASRFGEPKQLLRWRGKPLVWHVAHTALEAGLSPVIVVGGAYMEGIEQTLAGLAVEVIYNPDWKQGQGTSVGAGVRALPPERGAAAFLLADQPQIPVALLHQLVETHARTLSPIVAPIVAGQRTNPVLFDRDVFADLSALSGEIGGRKLFSKYPVSEVVWDDPVLLIDVDTPEDYHRLTTAIPRDR